MENFLLPGVGNHGSILLGFHFISWIRRIQWKNPTGHQGCVTLSVIACRRAHSTELYTQQCGKHATVCIVRLLPFAHGNRKVLLEHRRISAWARVGEFALRRAESFLHFYFYVNVMLRSSRGVVVEWGVVLCHRIRCFPQEISGVGVSRF